MVEPAARRTDVAAIVLTHRRVRLASQTVRRLLSEQDMAADRVLVVVNGEGGIEDDVAVAGVRLLQLPENIGPAGGYRRGLLEVATWDVAWAYVCEDDMGLIDLPPHRLDHLTALLAGEQGDAPVGAVVAFGRDLDQVTGRTHPVDPRTVRDALRDVDVAAWGATLVSMDAVRSGVLPDADLFFGYEDFDFFLRMRAAGYRVLLDTDTARQVYDSAVAQRTAVLATARPVDAQEPWRRYYEARNFLELRRRYGDRRWTLDHIAKSVRRAQLGPTQAHRRAIVDGLRDGFLGRTGKHPAHQREVGEH